MRFPNGSFEQARVSGTDAVRQSRLADHPKTCLLPLAITAPGAEGSGSLTVSFVLAGSLALSSDRSRITLARPRATRLLSLPGSTPRR